MRELTHNVQPAPMSLNVGAAPARQQPMQGEADAEELARTWREVIPNSALSQSDLVALGAPRLRELLSRSADPRAVAAVVNSEFRGYDLNEPEGQPGAQTAPAIVRPQAGRDAPDEFAGYSLNDPQA